MYQYLCPAVKETWCLLNRLSKVALDCCTVFLLSMLISKNHTSPCHGMLDQLTRLQSMPD